ncbi:MAG: asparagine synthase family protein [Halobacteriota archaeon]
MENGLTYSMKALGETLISRSDSPSTSILEVEDRRHTSFARAIIHNSESLVLTRDFIGSFPLFYGSNDARTLCAFAPERKALWAAGIERILRVEPGSVVTIKSPDDIAVHAQERRQPSEAGTLIDIEDAADRLLGLLKAVTSELELVPSGVAFSGGLDSSLLCGLITGMEKNYYATGLPGSLDVKNAQRAARLLGIHLDILEFSLIDIESVLPHVLATIENCDPMHVALSIPQHVITQQAATDGYKTVVTGQGADELFAGYRKYQTLASAEPRDVNAALVTDIHNIAANNLERDNLIAAANSVDLVLPYLDPRVVALGLSIDWTLKLKDGINKYVLRKVAKQVLPLELACKQKKAMQYGTGVTSALRRLARNFRSSKKNAARSVSEYLRAVAEENDIRVAA